MESTKRDWLKTTYHRPDQALDAFHSGALFESLFRQFSVSGLSSASSANYNLSGAGLRVLSLTPYPGELGLVVRQVDATITDSAVFADIKLGGQTAPTGGLFFDLYRAGAKVQDFAPGNASFRYSTNMAMVRGSDEWKFEKSDLVIAALRTWWNFCSPVRGPIWLAPGDELRWTVPAGATIAGLPAFTINAKGFVYANPPD